MTVDEIIDRPELASLGDAWTNLLARYDQATIHSSFEWINLWTEFYLGDRELRVLVARDEQ